MTPKEKAKELVFRFYEKSDLLFESLSFIQAKECALILVDEVLKSNPTKINCDSTELNYGYYQEVKKEVEIL
jgi:hypothetical protein